jgi:hypothetical protein
MRDKPGTTSYRNSNRFLVVSAVIRVTPVMFPLGAPGWQPAPPQRDRGHPRPP